MAHIVFGVAAFLVVFLLMQVVLFRHLRNHPAMTRYHRLAVYGLALVASICLAWTYSVEIWDLRHPGVQSPIHVRIIYTYFRSVLGIVFLAMWIHSDQRNRITK